MKVKHTPGPWQAANTEDYPASPDSVCSAQEPDRKIADVTSGNPADKALVIAAPELLLACNLLLALPELYEANRSVKTTAAVCAAINAVFKATDIQQ